MEKKISFKNLSCLLWMLLFIPAVMLGQVNVGSPKAPNPYAVLELSTSVVKGGVRMPQLTTAERDAISSNGSFAIDVQATGLTIYNVTTNCIEYWNKSKWVSLCQGELDVTFNPPLNPSFPKEGGVNGPYTPVDKYPCTGQTPYTFTIITGSDFTTVDVINGDNGTFSIIMAPNSTASSRTAIVRVTNNCSGENKEFLFSQDANAELCGSFGSPSVSVSNGGMLCTGGAVYLQITNASDAATYIWTINEIEQGRGPSFTALRSGIYKVYVGAIGCTNASAPITVSDSGTTAPRNPVTISASNNGVVCSSSTVTLTAFNVPAAGTLTWYKNGVKTSKTGNPISLAASEAGSWFAVLEQGSCTSTPSPAIEVTVDNTSTPLAQPVVYVNGKSLSSTSSFCSNGSIELVLNNYSSYTTGVTVKWYNGLTLLGEGEKLSIVTPSGGDFVLRCVVSDNVGAFCSSELFENKSLTGTAPARPVIVSSPSSICGGTSAKLTATVSGSDTGNTYNWYKDGQLIAAEKTQTVTAAETGSYTVEVVGAGGCISGLSVPVVIGLSDFPLLSWMAVYDDKAEPGQVKTYQVASTFSPTSFKWIVDGNAVIQNGQGTNTVSIKFPSAAATVNIAVIAVNDCGESDPLPKKVEVADACTPVAVRNVSISPASGSLVAGGVLSMSVTATGSEPITYQWLRNGETIAGATSSTYTKNNAETVDGGVYTCAVSNSCTPLPIVANVGTVNVVDINNIVDGSVAGTGNFGGTTCFDIAFTEGPECGSLASRAVQKADFTKTFVYTFTSIGAGNNNLKFYVDDREGAVASTIVQSNIPSTLVSGGKYTITIKYKESLMTSNIPNPIMVKIYAIYKNSKAQENKISLTAIIKDCQCCGAYIAAGVWKNFMCHNLGADMTKDPLVASQEISGDYYQWGRPVAVATSYTAAVEKPPLMLLGDTLPAGAGWINGAKNTNDPCPAGYRVPKASEMEGVLNATLNPKTLVGTFTGSFTNFSAGVKLGTYLFLPSNGSRLSSSGNASTLGGVTNWYRGMGGLYWTSDSSTSGSTVIGSYMLIVRTSFLKSSNSVNYAMSVRCIEE